MKTVSIRPSIWHVIVTLFAMWYLNNFMATIAVPILFSMRTWPLLVFDTAMAFVWFYLFRDLFRQVALFLPSRKK